MSGIKKPPTTRVWGKVGWDRPDIRLMEMGFATRRWGSSDRGCFCHPVTYVCVRFATHTDPGPPRLLPVYHPTTLSSLVASLPFKRYIIPLDSTRRPSTINTLSSL